MALVLPGTGILTAGRLSMALASRVEGWGLGFRVWGLRVRCFSVGLGLGASAPALALDVQRGGFRVKDSREY